jgi:hypothetical protein
LNNLPPNPFRPTFGVSPPVVAGRYDLLEQFRIGLVEGPGSPGRASLYVGPRGSGKTVLLNELEVVAGEQGWYVIAETASDGLVARLVDEHFPALLARVDPDRTDTQVRSATAFGVGLGIERRRRHEPRPGLRSQLTVLTDILTLRSPPSGLLLTVDEVHGGDPDELRELGTTVQHCFREQRPVAFAAAGLPVAVQEHLLNDRVLTFLRRADRHHLGAVSPDEVRIAIEDPIRSAGRTIDPDALELAVSATRGYPFMIQMVGWQLWRLSDDADTISIDLVLRAIPIAVQRMGELVHEPALGDLSRGDRRFLAAMASDDGPSRTGEIARRLGVGDAWASQYRRRLIDAELVRPVRRGEFDFELPYLREYLRAHLSELQT